MELTREHFRTLIYYDFKKCLSSYEYKESLDTVFNKQAPFLATIYSWFKEFERERNSFQYQKKAVTDKNIVALIKIIEEDSKTTYAVIEQPLKIGFSSVRKIIPDQLHLKKVVSRFLPHHPSDFQKAERNV